MEAEALHRSMAPNPGRACGWAKRGRLERTGTGSRWRANRWHSCFSVEHRPEDTHTPVVRRPTATSLAVSLSRRETYFQSMGLLIGSSVGVGRLRLSPYRAISRGLLR